MGEQAVNKDKVLPTNVLNDLMRQYYDAKELEKKTQALIKPLNEEIKKYLIDNNIDKLDEDELDYKASISKTNKVSWVEPILIERLKKLGFGEAIKTKEYVDMTILESLLYNGKIKEKKIEDCKNVTEIITLRVNKK